VAQSFDCEVFWARRPRVSRTRRARSGARMA
jgi:hypothetical protein